MKKFVSLILAALLILSCVAFADNLEIVKYGDNESFLDNTDGTATEQTEAWLQVTADGGTIDCTVPLVLVFQTNIDGGSTSTEASSYYIENNSTAAIAVTTVAITDNGGGGMELLADDAIDEDARDKYSLLFDGEDVVADEDWEDCTKTAGTDPEEAGLYSLEGDGGVSDFVITMHTSPLTFITKQANDEAETPVPQKGVKVFTVAYTVKIDDSEAIGDTISGTGLGAGTYGPYNEAWNDATH